MNHLELEDMNKKDRLRKLSRVYYRVQSWILKNAGKVSPSDMNIAQAALREIEELTAWVDKQEQIFNKQHMKRLNQLWKKYA